MWLSARTRGGLSATRARRHCSSFSAPPAVRTRARTRPRAAAAAQVRPPARPRAARRQERTRARTPVVERRLQARMPWLGRARARRTPLAAPVPRLRVGTTCLPQNGTPIVWPAPATMRAQPARARAVRRRCVTAKPRRAVRKSRCARRLRRASVSSAIAARTHSTPAPRVVVTGPARRHS